MRLAALLLIAASASAQFRSGTREVLVDVVVRDKGSRPAHGLTAADFELREDGVVQKILLLREAGTSAVLPGSNIAAVPARQQSGATPPSDPLRQLHLVALVFERLSPEGRRLSRQAALDVLKSESQPNTHFGVFVIQNNLAVLLNYTADRDAVRKAVERATGGTRVEFSTTETAGMRSVVVGTTDPSGGGAGTTAMEIGGTAAVDGGGLANAEMARVMADVSQLNANSTRDQEGRASLYSLLAIVGDQRRVPGRKTVLYFSEGLQLPNSVWHVLESVVNAANRGNVSIYSIDARGLSTTRDSAAADQMLAAAGNANRRGLYDSTAGGMAVSRVESMATDTGLDAIRANPQNSLKELAESTGGFLAANTNDLRVPLRRALQEMANYYELTYRPSNERYDGGFRKIEVTVKRPGLSVRARDGYFAFPPEQEHVLFPYEIPLLRAIGERPPPRGVQYRASAYRFRSGEDSTQLALVMQTPLDGITFRREDNGKRFRTHLSAVTLLKAKNGNVSAKLARDLPLEIPAERLDEFRRGEFIVMQEAQVPAGHYTLESALADREGEKVGALRSALVVPSPAGGVRLSSVLLVRRVDESAKTDLTDPFQVTGGRVVPWLTDSVERVPGRPLVVYFTIYPMRLPEKPKLTVEILADQIPVARVTPALPEPLEDGSIRYVASAPLDALQPGLHEIRVTVEQAGTRAQESLLVTMK